MSQNNDNREFIGEFISDSCQLLIVDPSCLYNFKENGEERKMDLTYSGCCNATLSKEGYGALNKDQGFATSVGDGETNYKIYVKKENDKIKRITIEFP